jgi:WD40 repeat protein
MQGHRDKVCSVAFSPDSKYLASGSRDNMVKLWSVESQKEVSTLQGHTSWVMSVAFSPDSKYLASGSYDKTVKLWSVES